MPVNAVRVDHEELRRFCIDVFKCHRLTDEDAAIATDVLVGADMRAIPSHGVGRLWRYVGGLKSGQMRPDAQVKVLMETPVSLVLDADGSMGAPVSVRAMRGAIEKARENGSGFACVRESNHFGIAGYYAMLPLEHDMLGLAMTNTAALGVPTFGRQVMFGTNPLAFAAPAAQEGEFVLDMSTTVVTRGKIELYKKREKPLPLGWAVDRTGQPATEAARILDDMFHRRGGGILPLGGEGLTFGGHKGYGLAVMVDVLCAVLCGAPFGPQISDTAESSARVSHWFAAIRIDAFRDPDGFRRDMDEMLRGLRECQPAEGAAQVYFAGQLEREHEERARRDGIALMRKTYDQLSEIGEASGLTPPSPLD